MSTKYSSTERSSPARPSAERLSADARFSLARAPRLEFGPGALAAALDFAVRDGPAVAVLATGGGSFLASEAGRGFASALEAGSRRVVPLASAAEPSPEAVDEAALECARELLAAGLGAGACRVAAVGGGSALDAGKAVAAMVPVFLDALAAGGEPPSVADFLEGVGTRAPEGRRVPLVLCPTTAGTGSEATKNAVLSRVGPGGFKKSLRHDAYVADLAAVDPALALGCPRGVTAASGLDALTQILEAWTSPLASAPVRALCAGGTRAFEAAFLPALADGADLDARSGLAWAAWASGVALANAGLGAVHALASPLGAAAAVPHGVVCGRLLLPATRLNLDLLAEAAAGKGRLQREAALDFLGRYAEAGFILAGKTDRAPDDRIGGRGGYRVEEGLDLLMERLGAYEAAAGLAGLGSYGIGRAEAEAAGRAASAKTNPVPLEAGELSALAVSVL